MPIHFLPNDPLAADAMPLRKQTARRTRPKSRAGFALPTGPKQKPYELGTEGFLHWQCREAALAAVATWESFAGKLTSWSEGAVSAKRLALRPNDGVDFNAYYDRASVSFFEFTAGGRTGFSGASTDVVAHEVGHALLDVIRPDLWDSTLPETNAFHEAFGDCIALLTALADSASRARLLANAPDLGAANFLEATAEDLSDGIRLRFGATHPAAAPRHAWNEFQWSLPSTLPNWGPPDELISEIHSFGRLFSGCFYDLIRNLFLAAPNRNEAALAAAAKLAGKLLVEGTRAAPTAARFFQAVGRAMSLADESLHAGANHVAIRDAFRRHNIVLGSSAMTAPRGALAGGAPQLKRASAVLETSTRRDVLTRLGVARGERATVAAVNIGGERLAQVTRHREVDLGRVHKKLAGVVALAPESVLVGSVGARSVLASALPDSHTTTDEVESFVRSLIDNGNLVLDGAKKVRGVAAASASTNGGKQGRTHAIETHGRKKVLVRKRFACPGCGHRAKA